MMLYERNQNLPTNLMLILLLAALKPVIPFLAGADGADWGVEGTSGSSMVGVGVRATECCARLSFLLAARTISSYVTGGEGDAGVCCGSGGGTSQVSFSCSTSGTVSTRLYDDRPGRNVCSPYGDSDGEVWFKGWFTLLSPYGDRDWFSLGTLRFFNRLSVLATPLNIAVGVFGVLGRSSSSSSVSLDGLCISNEYELPLA